jgi:DNA-binding MarR family transcriptional regulator
MKDGDLTPRQLAVLVTVANNEGLSQTGLVDRTGIDRSTLADIVRRLQPRACCSAAAPKRMREPMP